jgi:hypothetical protein
MNVVIVGDVVTPIAVRRRKGRAEPHGVDAEPLEVVELRDQPLQVAAAVGVRASV